MLTRLAHLGLRAPKRVLAAAALLLVLGGLAGSTVFAHLSSGGFDDPSSASTRAREVLAGTFHTGPANLVLAVESPGGARSGQAQAAGADLAARLRRQTGLDDVQTFAVPAGAGTAKTRAAAGLVSRDGRVGLVTARVPGDDDAAPKRAAQVVDTLPHSYPGGVTVVAGGQAITYKQINSHVQSDLATSEAIAIPLTTIALILIFGSLYAALLPLAIGIVSIVGTFGVLRGLAALTDVSVFSINMTTALGLALAIDYSLLIVSRYREELRAGAQPHVAVVTTMQTAGRTVLFSALTVALSLASMLVFPLFFLRSFAYAGVAVVALATLAALTLLPALLTLVGPRIDSLDLRRAIRRALGRPEPLPKPVEQGLWYRFAHGVMRRALPVGMLVVAVLVTLGSPFLSANFGFPDERVLPPSASAYQVGKITRTDFATDTSGAITVVLAGSGKPVSAASMTQYARSLSELHGVRAVQSSVGTVVDGAVQPPAQPAMQRGDAAYLVVATELGPNSDASQRLVSAIRGTPAPASAVVGGTTAENSDALDAIGDALPWVLLIIVVSTLIVLFLFTGSVVLPVKALLLNTLSLTATFGAMVWIFQDGHLASWLFPDLTITGHVEASMPPLMFCLAFGLSMDYEVFLLSRIREAWLASDRTTADNTEAVAVGLGHTGRIVSASAVLMAIVFASIGAGSVSFMMLFGTGLTLAVLMDATVVRGMLVPAFMRVAGRWNWWAPAPLARLHDRIGLHEGPAAPASAGTERELVDA